MTGKYATFETDYWALDGSFVLPPKSTEIGYQVGWWSDSLSLAGKTYTVNPKLTNTFTIDHSVVGLGITFDNQTNEYATDFIIRAYDSSNALFDTITVTGNTTANYTITHTIANFRKIEIEIVKWVNAYRRARITEVDFGLIETYTDTELINANVLEEIDTVNNYVTSNEFKFTVDNQDKSFNILNPDGFYPALQRRQKLTPYIGVEKLDGTTEYVKMGVYYLKEWKSDEGALTASFTSRDILDIASQSDFAGATYVSKSLTYIATDVLTSAGITNYEIDGALDSIIVSGTLPKANHRESLQTVVIAGMAVIYSDREGKVIIKQLNDASAGVTIDFDNVYSSPKIVLANLINTITINGTAYVDPAKPSSEQTLSADITNPLIDITLAPTVANWLLTEYKKRFMYEVNWRQNPMLEAGDIVTIEDEFGQDFSARITKQEYNYQGYLSGKTNGKSGGV